MEARAAQAVQGLKIEMAKMQQQHDILIQQKTNEIANLKDTIELIKARSLLQSFSGAESSPSTPKPAEKFGGGSTLSGVEQELLNLAQQQAARESEIHAHTQRIKELEAELTDSKRLLELAQMQERVLKEEIRNSERSRKREGVDIDYLKQVVVKYLETEDIALINVMATLLEFSPEELATVKLKKRKPGGAASSLWGLLSPSK